MLEEVLGKAEYAGFAIQEFICDKHSSTNAIFCRHFPEGTITYIVPRTYTKFKGSKCLGENIYIYSMQNNFILTP